MFPSEHMVVPVKVTPSAGEGPYGSVPGTPVSLRCFPQQEVKLVRAADGADVVSSARLWLMATRRNRAACTIGADVELDGQHATIVAVAVHHPGAINLPQLLEVSLA